MKNEYLLVIFSLLVACTPRDGQQSVLPDATAPIEIKIVLVTMFERGADTGDEPGEFQLWNERRQLDQIFPFQGEHDLHYNADKIQQCIFLAFTGCEIAVIYTAESWRALRSGPMGY